MDSVVDYSWNSSCGVKPTHHMSICVEYSEEPSKTSGGRYHSVTTSLEYVLVGTDLALASPKEQKQKKGNKFGLVEDSMKPSNLNTKSFRHCRNANKPSSKYVAGT